MRESTFAKQLYQHFLQDTMAGGQERARARAELHARALQAAPPRPHLQKKRMGAANTRFSDPLLSAEEDLERFYLKAKARIWRMCAIFAYMCHVRGQK